VNQPPRRPSRPARTPTSRPRRVAGQRPEATAPDEVTDESVTDEVVVDEPIPEATPTSEVDLTKRAVPPTETSTDETDPDRARAAGGRRPLLVLVAVVVLLLALGAGELVYLAADHEPDPKPLTAERPVQAPDLEVRRVVDQAATAAKLILAGSSKDYDGQVAKAAATMTEPFAKKYRETKADIKDQFVKQKTEVVIDISAQGVVTASDDEIVALLFLTQTTQKGARGGVQPVQYRVTVTMTHTPDGWLVSNLVAL
jgi:Mce-associated membrane protein